LVSAGRVEGGLDVQAVIDDVRDELDVCLGLVPAAHDAERGHVPSFDMKPGMMVWSGRLRGARTLGWRHPA
jgi:hypothetical protein